MNELKNFSFEDRQIRALTIEGEPYFVGKDVAEVLGYSNSRKAIADHVDSEDKGVTKCYTLGGTQKLTVINESGLYSLILGSKLPTAKKFKHWVTSEVLPTIRKHGAYMTDAKAVAIVTDKNALADLLQQAADQLKEKDVKIERLTAELEVSNKKATYLDLIVETKDGMTATQVAQDYGLSAKKFNARSTNNGFYTPSTKVRATLQARPSPTQIQPARTTQRSTQFGHKKGVCSCTNCSKLMVSCL